ncbi:MAG: GNAT family N-acetyltransferase [Xanthomonadales bacterium]|nr:GNAT family N-acetyltransferase [Xanthomonadales bacterium]
MSENNTIWNWYSFAELNADTLYQMLALRCEVFVVEQNCPYQDMDGLDQAAWHLCGVQGTELVAYLRLLAPGVKYAEPAIGRVIVGLGQRSSGLGRELMEQGMQATERYYPGQGIRLSAQFHLQNFYTSLGFKPEGDEYLEDNIPHIEMFR